MAIRHTYAKAATNSKGKIHNIEGRNCGCIMANILLVYIYITSEFLKRREQAKPHLQLALQFKGLIFTLMFRQAHLVPFYRLKSKVNPTKDRTRRILGERIPMLTSPDWNVRMRNGSRGYEDGGAWGELDNSACIPKD